MRSALLLTAALLSAAAPARAMDTWYRWEALGVGFGAGRGDTTLRLVDLSMYHAVSGIGLGTAIIDQRFGRWDSSRLDRTPVHGGILRSYFPVCGYWAIWSGTGPLWPMPKPKRGNPDVARLELYGRFSDWARVENVYGDFGREFPGALRAQYLNAGLRLDFGRLVALEAGRLSVKLRARDGFAGRDVGDQWYGNVHLYLGASGGDSAGGGIYPLLKGAGHKIAEWWERVRPLKPAVR